MLSTSAVDVPPLQSLVGLVPGSIVPVQGTVRVWPTVVGTVTDWGSGVAANAPEAGTTNAPRARTEPMTTVRRMAHLAGCRLPPGGAQRTAPSRGPHVGRRRLASAAGGT